MVNPGSAIQGGVVCGACKHTNTETAQFCSGCGHSLFEACASCSQPVRLEQKYCDACGMDLQGKRHRLRQQYEEWLVSSVEAAKQSDFERAIGLLGHITPNKDYRYADLNRQATLASEKIEKLRAQRLQIVEAAYAEAVVAMQNEDRASVIELLSRVPEAMRTPEIRQMLDQCSAFVNQINELESKLQARLAAKDYEGLASVIEVLLGLVPKWERYVKLGHQVAEKLLSSSNRCFENQDYQGAVKKLSAVPAPMRDERYEVARRLIENTEWLEQQFSVEPFASATLGRLAARFEKESPKNERAKLNTKELLGRLKQPLSNPRNPFNEWRGPCDSWLGGKVGYLGYPASIPVGSDENLRRQPGRFSVAIGLAIQGLGLGVVKAAFAVKRSRFSVLGGKKPTQCWGVDIGASGLRAIQLQLDKETLTVVDTYCEEFEIPTNRVGSESSGPEMIRAAVGKFVATKTTKDIAVWVNLPAGELIARFVRLPPVSDKQAGELLAAEAKQRIPMPPDILDYVTWTGKLETDSAHGRAGFVCAAKKTAVISRTSLLADAGLTISGMQSDQLAIVNFVSREFATRLGEVDSEKSTLPTVAILDAGAEYTSLVLVNQESFWFWSIELGGEDLTSALARGAQVVHAEAESLKRYPAKITHPRDSYEFVERRLDELRSRMQKLFAEAISKNGRFEIAETWCVGGAPLTHAWIRRVLLGDSRST